MDLYNLHNGHLTPEMEQILAEVVKDRKVYDFGCAAGYFTRMIAKSAASVVGVDKHRHPYSVPEKNIMYVQSYFAGYDLPEVHESDVAFVSFPINSSHDYGLLRLIKPFQTVVYLGANYNHTSCGYFELYFHLIHRPVMHTLQIPRNTFTVYGKHDGNLRRELLFEEIAAMTDINMIDLQEHARGDHALL